MKNLIIGVVLTLLSSAVGFALIEGFVRITSADGQNFDIEMWRYAKDLKRVSQIPGVGHEHIPDRSGTYMGVEVELNSVGWRDKDYALEKPEGTTRILMLGDSLTFGWGAPADGITSAVLEDLLNQEQEGRYEVLNTGIGNTNTAMQTAYFLHEGHRYKPDIVVLNYFINDAEPTPQRKTNLIIENSYAAVLIAGKIDILARTYGESEDWYSYYRGLYNEAQPGWKSAREALRQLAEFCEAQGIDLVVVHYPELHELADYPFQDVTNKLALETGKLDLPFLDLLPAVKEVDPVSLWVTPTDAHPNKKAAELYAPEIHRFLRDYFPRKFD